MNRFLIIASMFIWGVACNSWLPTKAKVVSCSTDTDCPSGWQCGADKLCASSDASMSDGGLSDGADAGGADTLIGCALGAACPADKPSCVANVCVECSTNDQCAAAASKPFCVANQCATCATAEPTACATATAGAKPVCGAAGTCVECNADTDCKSPLASFCVGNQCKGCGSAAAMACATRDANLPTCGATGACVECDNSNQCINATKPICASNTCRACTADAECMAKLGADPGVCMSHDDGRCATAAETVKVEGGDLQAAITAAASEGKKLVLVTTDTDRATYAGPNKLAIIGKVATTKPAIGGGTRAGLTISGGEVFLRDLLVTNSTPGIVVSGGGVLRARSCDINGNSGGVLIDGGAFDIDGSEISDNKIGSFGVAKFGGILVNNPGTPKRLSKVKVLNNKQTGVVCSAPITIDQVTATGNVGENIAPECQ